MTPMMSLFLRCLLALLLVIVLLSLTDYAMAATSIESPHRAPDARRLQAQHGADLGRAGTCATRSPTRSSAA